MSNQGYMPKSKSDVHLTPDKIYKLIEEKWGVSKEELFDPCPENPKFDGLDISWKRFNYVNPPYPRLGEFVEKAERETAVGNTTFLLLPAKTDQDWFHEHIIPRINEVIWIKRRLHFKNDKWSSPQSHLLVRFYPYNQVFSILPKIGVTSIND